MTFFYNHDEEIAAAIADLASERAKLAQADFPAVRSLSGCVVCHQPKNPGLICCWQCWNDMEADKIAADHILELVADAEMRNGPREGA